MQRSKGRRHRVKESPTQHNDSQENYSTKHHIPNDSQWTSGNQAQHLQQAGSPVYHAEKNQNRRLSYFSTLPMGEEEDEEET